MIVSRLKMRCIQLYSLYFRLPSSNQLGQKTLAEMKCRLFLNLGLTSEAEGNTVTATEFISKVGDALKQCKNYVHGNHCTQGCLHFQAIAISKNMELWEDLYRCYTAEGSIYMRQRCTAKALAAYEKGLQVAERCEKKTQFLCELLSLKADVCQYLLVFVKFGY